MPEKLRGEHESLKPSRDGMDGMHRVAVQLWGKRVLMKHPALASGDGGLWGLPERLSYVNCIVNIYHLQTKKKKKKE